VLKPDASRNGGQAGAYYSATATGFRKLLASFSDYGFHCFRKTLASSLYANGVLPPTIDAIFGWAPTSVRDRYYVSIDHEDLAAAIKKAYVREGGLC
jgi:integrase